MASSIVWGTFTAVAIALLAVFYQYYVYLASEWAMQQTESVVRHLLQIERQQPMSRKRVIVGIGACQDVFVDAIELLKELELVPSNEKRHFHVINNLTEMEQSFNYYFAEGAAAERFFSNSEIFHNVLLDTLDYMSTDWIRRDLGGNAPVMSLRFAESWDVALAANVHFRLLDRLPKGVELLGHSTQVKDVHVLMEYKTGDRWGDIVAPRANRFIVHNDQDNPFLTPLELMIEKLRSWNPHLIVFGGLQMMDNYPYPPGKMEMIFFRFQKYLSEDVPASVMVHLEFASFTDPRLLHEIMMHIVKYSDSLGMNEQELENVHSLLTHGKVVDIAEAYPSLDRILEQSRLVFTQLLSTPEVDGKRKISRLHVHTIGFQVIVTRLDRGWKSGRAACAKASLIAYRHTCQEQQVNRTHSSTFIDTLIGSFQLPPNSRVLYASADGAAATAELGADALVNADAAAAAGVANSTGAAADPSAAPLSSHLDHYNPALCWLETVLIDARSYEFEICITPTVVCNSVKQTTGAGDNISSGALMMQL